MLGYRRLLRTRGRPTPHRIRLELEALEERSVPAVLTYSSYFGGDNSDQINSVATDAAGNIFVGGVLNDSSFPGPGGPGTVTATAFNGFVSELNPTATQVIFTALIHTDQDGVRGIAVDASDNVYLTGATDQATGFATPGAAQTTFGGFGDAFAMKLDATTHAVVYATYIGGSFVDVGYAITVNQAGDAIVTGDTSSSNFPVSNALQSSLLSNAGTDAFVTELNATGSSFLFSTYLGGSSPITGGGADSHGRAIALDKDNNMYLTGYTEAVDFSVTTGAYQTTPLDAQSAFVTELAAPTPTSQIKYSTFLCSTSGANGTGYDHGYGIALDSTGNILITGSTTSVDFPIKNAFQKQLDRGGPAVWDSFVTKLNPTNAGIAQLVYSTFDGGSADERGNAVAVDSTGNAFVAGFSGSDTHLGKWPVVNPFPPPQQQVAGSAFVAEFSPTGHVVFNSKYGDVGEAYAITVSPFGNVIVAGNAQNKYLHPTANAFQDTMPGSSNGFIAMVGGARVPKTFKGVDSDGDAYTVTLTGPGAINVIQDDPGHTGAGPIQTIYLQGTNASSILNVVVTKTIVSDGRVAIGSIVGTGLGRINAPKSDLTGSGINLTGALGYLTLHDVASGAGIRAADLSTQSTTIHAHVINDGTTIQVGGRLGLLAARVGADTITSPRLTTLTVTGDKTLGISGDFAANLTLTDTGPALGTVTIAGNVNSSSIHVPAGRVGTVYVAGQITGADIQVPSVTYGSGSIASLRAAASISNTTINVGTSIGLLQAASMDTDTITAAHMTTLRIPGNTTLAISGNMTATSLTVTGIGTALGTVTVAGQVDGTNIHADNGTVSTFTAAAFANSNVVANVVSRMVLNTVQTNNGGTAFGIDAHKAIGLVHVVSPLPPLLPPFTYNRNGPALQKIGDFEVQLL